MQRESSAANAQAAPGDRHPRLGFFGVGWIGRHKLKSISEARHSEIMRLADLVPGVVAAATLDAPGSDARESLDTLLAMNLDGLVIATPTALHAEQAIVALEAGVAVFCQKPLGRNAAETRRVLGAAQRADRFLAVDRPYRFVRGIKKIKELVQAGEIGSIYAMDLAFHNAYGPDRPWYYDPQLSAGGCVIDLGIHLVDLALWVLDFPQVTGVSSRLFAQGKPLTGEQDRLEDYASARLHFSGGAIANLACSWHLPAGHDAVIHAFFYGTKGGLSVYNVNGSFYDFRAERLDGTTRKILDEPPDDWGGRGMAEWAERLAASPRYDPEIERACAVAEVIDAIYGQRGAE